jgi:hypothetical protein
MNRLISAVVALLVGAAGSAAGGYWNPEGVVPLGDARIPAAFVGWLITGLSGLGGLSAGGAMPWTKWVSGLLQKIKDRASSVTLSSGTIETVASKDLQRSIVSDVPIEVEHLQGCVYHLRKVLHDNAKAQDLLDQIAVMVGRATADVPDARKGGDQ